MFKRVFKNIVNVMNLVLTNTIRRRGYRYFAFIIIADISYFYMEAVVAPNLFSFNDKTH